MKLKFSSWKNSDLQRRYRDMCTKFSEIADRVAANDEEYSAMNDWLIETMKSLKIVDRRPLRLKAQRKRTAAEKLQAIAESETKNQNATEDTIKQWGVMEKFW
ncbi:hypothetical protein MKX01_022578 [Papaver californicum]|nr:hypothetical protein MKX01_022578 [Papaver californicum]